MWYFFGVAEFWSIVSGRGVWFFENIFYFLFLVLNLKAENYIKIVCFLSERGITGSLGTHINIYTLCLCLCATTIHKAFCVNFTESRKLWCSRSQLLNNCNGYVFFTFYFSCSVLLISLLGFCFYLSRKRRGFFVCLFVLRVIWWG